MRIEIIDFPLTKVAAVEHEGSPATEFQSVQKLINWRKENNYPPSPKHRNYGLHYNSPQEICADDYRVDICLSVADEIAVNNHGVINKVIPACRCVRARHIGSRDNIPLAQYLYEKWLPQSGYRYSGQPIIFHYVNVGPHIQNHEMITDVYLPIA